jgi:hypothetical protein
MCNGVTVIQPNRGKNGSKIHKNELISQFIKKFIQKLLRFLSHQTP